VIGAALPSPRRCADNPARRAIRGTLACRASAAFREAPGGTAMITLYYAPSACSLAPHIALEETGEKFETKPIALRKGQQRTPEYVAVNPKSKVPALLIDGKPLTENVAILSYIAKRFPKANLLPTGDLEREMQALSLLAWCTAGIQPVLSRFFGPLRICDAPGSEEATLKLARAENDKNFSLVEKMLEGKEYVLDRFSVVDCLLYVYFNWAKFHKLDLAAYPNYAAHNERMAKRPAVQRAHAREKEGQKLLDAA
jgi:glutathione S-transferase